ncbi:MAG: N-6 DNA methylase [Candidatus Heimdallarchaeota archaeon]|nr:MAG: N-6 DNA methylase [Candidatus Heimdallarchaeota archaeon]
MVKRQKLEDISRYLWQSFNDNQQITQESWVLFLNLFFEKSSLHKLTESLDPIGDIIPLAKVENLFFFLSTKNKNYKLVLKEILELSDRLNFGTMEKSYLSVINLSTSGIHILIFKPQGDDLIRSLWIVRFPRGYIPCYFKEILGSDMSPLEFVHRLTDIHSLEAEFLNNGLKIFLSSDDELQDYLISYTTLLLIHSRISNNQIWFDKFRREYPSPVRVNLILSKLSDWNVNYDWNDEDLSTLSNLLCDFGLGDLPIDLDLYQNLLEKYPFSFNEASAFVHEVAITPSVLSLIAEGSSVPSKDKKTGKFYTSIFNTDFITYLAVYRALNRRLNAIESDILIKQIYHDWGFEIVPEGESTDQSIRFPSRLKILDPACGSGTFLISIARLLSKLTNSSLTTKRENFPIVELHGIDPDKLAVLVTRLRLFFFKMQEQLKITSVDITERKKTAIQMDIEKIINSDFLTYEFQDRFDIICGNPPWVRHEDILPIHKKKLQTRFDARFGKSSFDQKSDLYIYFCIISIFLLKNNGVLAFLTSNAWLEVRYGRTLQKFLLDPSNEIGIFEIIYSRGSRLWHNLGINSIILIAEKSANRGKPMQQGVFTEVYVNYSQLSFNSLRKGLIPRKNHEDRCYRTELVKRAQLCETHKWAGNFLRTSRNERKILTKINTTGVSLSSLADIRFGIKTGANEFFHLQHSEKEKRIEELVYIENQLGYKGLIERRYLVPLIKSPTEVNGYYVPDTYLPNSLLFYCLDSPSQLEGTEAWKYITWAERTPVTIKQGRKSGTTVRGVSLIRSVQNRENWYSLTRYPTPTILWTKSYHDRPGCIYNKAHVMPDQRFYGISVDEKYVPLILTYLNSSLIWALMESHGNTNMGYGVLDTNVYWLKSLRVPIEANEDQKITQLMKRLLQEKERTSIVEYSPLRTEIDHFYAEYLQISEEMLEIIYEYNLKSVSNRIQK